MLELQDVRKSFGDRDILRNVGFHVAERERVALVGPNGVGKSTLLKLILGVVHPDGGLCRLTPSATVAYLPQEARCVSEHSLAAELRAAFADLTVIEEKQRSLEGEMTLLAPDDARLMPMVAELGRLHDEFERLGGYTMEAEIGKVLAGLGFQTSDREKQACDFSGGWQMRIALARLLLQRPSLLLLDEPTNHLDLPAVAWLEEYLRASRSAIIVVSHDRYFLDRVSQRTLELADGAVRDWPGNYSRYVTEKAKQEITQEAAYKRQQEYVSRQEAFVERFRASARRSAQAKSRERALDKMDRVEAPRKASATRFRFAAHRPSGREVFALKGVSKGYDGRPVFGPVDLLVEKGEKIALLGENGAGKTTMLRMLAGVEQPDRGTLRIGLNVQRSYYAQHQADTLDVGKNVLDEVYHSAPPDWPVGNVRTLLGRFGVTGDDVFKPIAVLSGGERSRVALAKMLLRPANVLLLDEPTNHLDIAAREMLEDALLAYDGTVVLVSHDRYLIDRVATKVIELAGEGLNLYGGNYSYYLLRKAKEAELAALPKVSHDLPRESNANRRRGSLTRQASPAKQLASVEGEIATLEATLHDIAAEMADPSTHADQARTGVLFRKYQDIEARLAELNECWESLARAVEEIPQAAIQ